MENHVLRIVSVCGNTCQDLKVVLINRGWFVVTLMKQCGNMSIFQDLCEGRFRWRRLEMFLLIASWLI